MYNEDDFISYDVLTEEQIKSERGLLLAGEYEFIVRTAIKKLTSPTAKNPNQPMIELELSVFDAGGKEYRIKDWLTFLPNMAWKLKNFFSSIGDASGYNGKTSVSSLVGKSGFVKTKLGKNKNGHDQANVQDYITVVTTTIDKKDDFDMDLPGL